MTDIRQIGWGSYMHWEGPLYFGSQKQKMPTKEASLGDKVLAVIGATEGNAYDAVNMYDQCICTVGLIQWCEAGMFGVSNMLGDIAEKRPDLVAKLPCKLEKQGQWRFVHNGRQVLTQDAMKQMYLGGSSGRKGEWSPGQRAIAVRWAAELSTMFFDKDAQQIQRAYSAQLVDSYVFPGAKATLKRIADPVWRDAMYAAYLSFAANLPSVAAKHLKIYAEANQGPADAAWCAGMLRQLTFGSGIAIYPGRYEKIRPVLETLFGIDLPDHSEDLRKMSQVGTAMSVSAIQYALRVAGFDTGPLDGNWGPKTKNATILFQTREGLQPDGIVGKLTAAALQKYQGKP